nr:hypothetical protein [Bacteroides intestinalis]
MKGTKKWSALALIVGMATLFSSCAVHRHPRSHRPHPHRHKVVIIAEQTRGTEQNTDYITFETCLAMTEPGSYGSTE